MSPKHLQNTTPRLVRATPCPTTESGPRFNYSDWSIRIIMAVIIFTGPYSSGIRSVGCIMHIKENREAQKYECRCNFSVGLICMKSNRSKNKVYMSIYSQPAWDYISL